MMLTENQYNHINKSFKRKVVFRIGLAAGFFSEYNNMIFAMAWCLRNNYQFQLFSSEANFGFDKGWADYFIPFCTEVSNKFHLRYNHRPYPYGSSKYYPLFVRSLVRFGFMKANLNYLPVSHRLKRKFGLGKLLTQDIFVIAHSQNPYEEVEISKLGFNGNFKSLCKILTHLTWRFNQKTQMEIDRLINELNLPATYVGFHIRRGDKFVETQHMSLSLYIEKAETISDLRTAFVSTDDYNIINELHASYPAWHFYTLCQPHERGYYQSEFQELNILEKKISNIRLFSSMVVLEHACHFIGTFSSNMGIFLGMRMSPENCHGIDFNEWNIW
jgi:Alpha-(1,6)-fucosyltransferase N- and catalytic domains